METTYEFAHLGINHDSPEETKATAELLLNIFGFRSYDIGNSIFSSGSFELVKTQYKGTKGHIGIYTNNIKQAILELEEKNVKLDYDTLQKNLDDQYVSIYFKEEIAGFAVHLLQKS